MMVSSAAALTASRCLAGAAPGALRYRSSALLPIASRYISRSISTTAVLRNDSKKGVFGRIFSGSEKKKDGAEEEENSLFDSIAPAPKRQPLEFDLIDMSMQKKDEPKPGEETKTEEDRELEELNRSLDQYTAGEEGKPEAKGESAEEVKIPPEEDPELLAITKPTPKKAIDVLLSPLQKAVYLRQKTGKDDPLIMGKKYKFKVNRRLEELLEPSLWIKSHTLSGSVKKVTPLLRSLRKMTVTRAIAHCHFNVKHEAKHLETLLYRALDEAKALGMSTEGLYIDQVWSGKEPKPEMTARSRIDYKGRGRAGTFFRKEHHVQMIIKTPVTLQRIAAQKKKKMMGKKPWNTLRDKPFYDKRGQEYIW